MKAWLFGALLCAVMFVSSAAAQTPTPPNSAGLLHYWNNEPRNIPASPASPTIGINLGVWQFPNGPYTIFFVVSYSVRSNAGDSVLNCAVLSNNTPMDRATASISGNNTGGAATAGTLTLVATTGASGGPYNLQLKCNGAGSASGSVQRVEKVAVRAIRVTDTAPLTVLMPADPAAAQRPSN